MPWQISSREQHRSGLTFPIVLACILAALILGLAFPAPVFHGDPNPCQTEEQAP